MTTPLGVTGGDALGTLRAYRAFAPWSLRELSALAGTLLTASKIYPVNAAARAVPSERTIRFYVSRGLVTPPEGRGTSAIYVYRHLLQVLAIKLRQMEGATLETIRRELSGLAGDVVERRVAAALGPALPPPETLTWSRRGRAAAPRHRTEPADMASPPDRAPCLVRRIPISPGCELLIDEGHALLRRPGDQGKLAAAVRRALVDLDGA
jgi:DNA-binding transcriptional MerR regulator